VIIVITTVVSKLEKLPKVTVQDRDVVTTKH